MSAGKGMLSTVGRPMHKQVLITGGAQRLGAALVRNFASQGWQVWCHYNHSLTEAQTLASTLESLGHRIHLVQANLDSSEDIDHMMDHIAKSSGPLHALVNNASLFEPDTGVDFSIQKAQQQLDVNLLAPLYLGQRMAKQIQEAPIEDGCIIHILDQKVFNLNPDYFSYTLSKLALERAVALQAQALAPHLRVCGVAPGLMYLSGPQSQANFDLASQINLMRRATDPDDVAKTCVFLASTPSITGATIQVDNGQHLVPLQQDVMFVVEEQIQKKHEPKPAV